MDVFTIFLTESFRVEIMKNFEGMKFSEIKDANDPFENHWSDTNNVGFNRGLEAKKIHEIFRDGDGQGNKFLHFFGRIFLIDFWYTL